MNIKKLSIIFLILLFLLIPVSFAADGDFTIPSANIDVTVNKDASITVTEEIVYDIEGSITGVYRDIPVKDNQEITNISVETPGYYNTVTVDNGESTIIKVYIYADEGKTQTLKDEKVSVSYTYTATDAVDINFNDAELRLITWGNEWKSGVDHLESKIHIPGSNDGVEYRNTYGEKEVSGEWTSSDTLTTKVDNIAPYTSVNQYLKMPKSFFTSDWDWKSLF